MKFISITFSLATSLLLLLACKTQQMKPSKLRETDTLGILKASLDSSLAFVKKTPSHRTADTSVFMSEFYLDTVMQGYFSRTTTNKLKYLDKDSLCKIAHQEIRQGICSNKITCLILFKRDSVGDFHVALERGRLLTITRIIKGDTIRSCEFGGEIEWTIFLNFKKIENNLQPQVDHWEIH